MIEVDPSTREWRELFGKAVAAEFEHHEKLLIEIRDLGKLRNSRVRANEIAIAGLKTWVAVVGGLTGVGALISGMMWVLK